MMDVNPVIVPAVTEIVNLFAERKWPIGSLDEIYANVKMVMLSQPVNAISDPREICRIDIDNAFNLLRSEDGGQSWKTNSTKM